MFHVNHPLVARLRVLAAVALVFVGQLGAAACGGNPVIGAPGSVLRLGYLPNLTHAPALIAVGDGSLQEELGPGVRLQTKVFNAGPAIIEAMFAGELDAAYIGPSPAINGYQRSGGEALRVVSGATTGGAQFTLSPAFRDRCSGAGRSVLNAAACSLFNLYVARDRVIELPACWPAP